MSLFSGVGNRSPSSIQEKSRRKSISRDSVKVARDPTDSFEETILCPWAAIKVLMILRFKLQAASIHLTHMCS